MSGEAASLCPSCGAHEVRHEFDLGCEICGACGHLVSDRALTTVVSYDDDGARGVFLHDGSASGQHLAAARHGLAGAPGATPGVTRAMFRDQDSAHLANISRAVDFAAQQLRLSKDAANDARALVVKASEGRWGDGDWTTLLVGACVYVSARQNALPIAMRDVAEACQIDLFALGRVYNKLKRLHGVRVPPLDPNAFVARAAAAVPELTAVSISGQKGGKGGGLVGGGDDTEARKEASNRSNGKSVANKGDEEKKNVTEKSTTASRAKDLAPLIHDAKILLKFAHSRGLVTGRNPVPFVAACLGVAAQSRGVSLSHEKTAAAARSSAASTRRASRALREELVVFCASFVWGVGASVRTLHVYLPSLVKHVAGALHQLSNLETRNGNTSDEQKKTRQESTTAAARRIEGMPVSFRHHEKTRVLRNLRVAATKRDTLISLDGGGQHDSYGQLPARGGSDVADENIALGEEDTEAETETPAGGLVVASAVPPGPVTVKRPTRGGAKSSRRKKAKVVSFGDRDDATAAAAGGSKKRTARKQGSGSDDETFDETFGFDETFDFDWHDLAVQRLLLEGVPERYVVEEKGLYAAENGNAGAAGKSGWKQTGAKKCVRGVGFGNGNNSLDAVERVRRRVAEDKAGSEFDFEHVLPGGVFLPGGVTWKAPRGISAVERFDKNAMDQIPDHEIDELIRTPTEVALAVAVAESALGGGGGEGLRGRKNTKTKTEKKKKRRPKKKNVRTFRRRTKKTSAKRGTGGNGLENSR